MITMKTDSSVWYGIDAVNIHYINEGRPLFVPVERSYVGYPVVLFKAHNRDDAIEQMGVISERAGQSIRAFSIDAAGIQRLVNGEWVELPATETGFTHDICIIYGHHLADIFEKLSLNPDEVLNPDERANYENYKNQRGN